VYPDKKHGRVSSSPKRNKAKQGQRTAGEQVLPSKAKTKTIAKVQKDAGGVAEKKGVKPKSSFAAREKKNKEQIWGRGKIGPRTKAARSQRTATNFGNKRDGNNFQNGVEKGDRALPGKSPGNGAWGRRLCVQGPT